MREELINMVAQRAGLDQTKASQAVDTVLGFLKENPEKLQELVGEHAGGIGGRIGKMFGR